MSASQTLSKTPSDNITVGIFTVSNLKRKEVLNPV